MPLRPSFRNEISTEQQPFWSKPLLLSAYDVRHTLYIVAYPNGWPAEQPSRRSTSCRSTSAGTRQPRWSDALYMTARPPFESCAWLETLVFFYWTMFLCIRNTMLWGCSFYLFRMFQNSEIKCRTFKLYNTIQFFVQLYVLIIHIWIIVIEIIKLL
jgi:hypothetical protein